MALVTHLERAKVERTSIHPTQVTCKYIIVETDGRKLLQLNTYGSADREMPDKISQTLQFDERTALNLFNILKKEFGLS